MTVVLALEKLYDDVDALFTEESFACVRTFGWREPQKTKIDAKRIVWVPGDPSGALGAVKSAKSVGGNPRQLGTLEELFTVYVAAADPTDPENERKAYAETRNLFDAWWRAAFLSATKNVSVVSSKWNTSKNERRYGAEIVAVCAILAPIFDTPAASIAGPADPARAEIIPELDSENDEEGTDDETIIVGDPIPQAAAATTAAVTLSGEQTVDGVVLVEDDVVLVKNQTTASENGRYVVSAGAWTQVAETYPIGFFVHVAGGTVNGNAGFTVTIASPRTFTRTSP